jgi:IMP dehydrogenase
MKKYIEKALSFDDILLVPQHSDVKSRKNVDLVMNIGRDNRLINLGLPIIAAPMDTVCDEYMSVVLANMGATGSIHRYMSNEQQINIARNLREDGYINNFFAIGATGDFFEHAQKLVGEGVSCLIVDTANGHSEIAIRAVERLRELPVHIMAGNVSTWEGFKRLSDAGADSIRVGIGGGSACTTRIVTGHGIPTLASIMDIVEHRKDTDASIIADGGIRNSGDAVKAFAAGAHAVMLGSVLAGHDESPGETHYDSNGNPISKEFRGMASADAQHSRGYVSVVEGVSTVIPYKGTVVNTLISFENGIKSGISYSGIDKLSDLSVECMYVEVSSLAKGESIPHAIK